MEIKEAHKALLRQLGLKEEDFLLFDGAVVSYEYDEKRGVRLYDPYYRTSYEGYIEVSGWSSWTSEKDTFMRDILKGMKEEMEPRDEASPKASEEAIAQALEKRFGE